MHLTQAAVVGLLMPAVLTTPAWPADGPASDWHIGTPIVTYWAGPAMTDAVARQMAEGGWNVVWCREQDLDLVHSHGLRAQLHDGLINPAHLDNPDKRAQLDALIDRVKDHPALYCYYITDEPNASRFPELGRLVAYLRERDPAHMAYINLFPTYASNEQLGNQGDTETAYREHVRQYLEIVKPDLISYDHYHFAAEGKDRAQYFLNLGIIREFALSSGKPFLNIVQACSWTPGMRVPASNEVRWLVFTSLAYGAQGISYYVYCHPRHVGAIANADGSPTVLYHSLKTINRDFAAIAGELQSLRSLGAYHLGMLPPGGAAAPPDLPFRLEPPVPSMEYQPPAPIEGVLLGAFGPPGGPPTHVMVVNLDYGKSATTTLVAPGDLETFNPRSGAWAPAGGRRASLRLPAGGGRLLRLAQ